MLVVLDPCNICNFMLSNRSFMKIIVGQQGARHRYLIPRMLENAGVLSAFYTDSSAHSLLGKFSAYLPKGNSMRRLCQRQVQGVLKEKLFSSDCLVWEELQLKLIKRMPDGLEKNLLLSKCLSKKMISWGVGDADIVFTMNRFTLDYVKYAKVHGLKSVIDVFICPRTERIMAEEALNHPEWGYSPCVKEVEKNVQLYQEMVELADLLLCPSEWVKEGLTELFPEAERKIRIVPYGSSISPQFNEAVPESGRMFFAGRDPLRKGLQYLLPAIEELHAQFPDIFLNIAGLNAVDVPEKYRVAGVNFLGYLNNEQMKEQFSKAQSFIFPSLSEGFAGVIAEAAAYGIPLILTKESGSSVVDGKEGIVVPARDKAALKQAIYAIYSDHGLRQKMFRNSEKMQLFLSEAEWQKRLVKTIADFFNV